MIDGDVPLADLVATQATDALIALVHIVTVDGLYCSCASFPRPARGFIRLGFPGMGLTPSRPSGRNLVRVGVAEARIPLPHMRGMGHTKILLLLLHTCFAAALVPIRASAVLVERVQRLDQVAGRARLPRLTGFAGVHQAVRVAPVAIKLVEWFALVTGLAALRQGAAVAFPAGEC